MEDEWRDCKAFSMIELLITIALLAIVAGIGFATVGNVRGGAKEQKLKIDLATLNTAVGVFKGYGGNFKGMTDPALIIAKLKLAVSMDDAKRIPGLSSSMLDARVKLRLQTEKQGASDDPRLYWDATKRVFTLARTGPPGIAQILLDENAPAEVSGTADAKELAFLYSGKSGWIWDFEDGTKPVMAEPTLVSLAPSPTEVPDVGTVIPVTPPTAPIQKLMPPSISLPAGAYEIRDYTLYLEVTNPNPPGSSTLKYSLDFAAWQNYTGPINVPPDSTIQTQVVSLNTESWDDSRMIVSTYSATPVTLDPPLIIPSAPGFSVISDPVITLLIEDVNAFDPSFLEYRIDGGIWAPYAGPFSVSSSDYDSGLTVESRAVSDSPYYLTSATTAQVLAQLELDLEAAASGMFHSPEGEIYMETNLSPENSESPYFEWGSIYDQYGNTDSMVSKSRMDFAGNTISTKLNSRIDLGTLSYYNGSIYEFTGADFVYLGLDIGLAMGGNDIDLSFDFQFDLINVINDYNAYSGDQSLAMASADYVQINDASRLTSFQIDGVEFELALEFGGASGAGFSTFDQFHVVENETAETHLFATITRVKGKSKKDDD